MAKDYLHTSLRLHGLVTELRFGATQHLDRVQRNVQATLSGGRPTYEVIQAILDSNAWNANMFGHWPPAPALRAAFGDRQWDLARLPDSESAIVRGLLAIFRRIEPVSVVLRFVSPKDYGIVSPPVEEILGVAPRRLLAEKYRVYLECLRELRDQREFNTAADVEMALWTLQVGVLDGTLAPHRPQQTRFLRTSYDKDLRMREIRVGNLTKPIFDDLGKLDLAEALLPTDIELAAQIAGIEFEKKVRRWLPSEDHEDLYDVIEQAYRQRGALHRARVVRNRAMHKPQKLRRADVEYLIDSTKRVPESGTGRMHSSNAARA